MVRAFYGGLKERKRSISYFVSEFARKMKKRECRLLFILPLLLYNKAKLLESNLKCSKHNLHRNRKKNTRHGTGKQYCSKFLGLQQRETNYIISREKKKKLQFRRESQSYQQNRKMKRNSSASTIITQNKRESEKKNRKISEKKKIIIHTVKNYCKRRRNKYFGANREGEITEEKKNNKRML